MLHPLILRPLILRSGPSWVCVSKDEGSLASISKPAGTLVLRDAMRSRIAPQEEGVGLLNLAEHPHNAPYPATLSGAGLGRMCPANPKWKGGAERRASRPPACRPWNAKRCLFRLAGVETRRSAHGVGGLLRRIPGGRHSPRLVPLAARPWPARNHQPDFNRIRQQGAANGTEQPGLLTGCRPAEPCDLDRRTREGA